MDALSAMKMMVGQGINPQAPAKLEADALPKISLPELNTLDSAGSIGTGIGSVGGGGGSFQDLFGNLVSEVSNKQAAAGEMVNGLMSGKNVSLHQAMISMEEASISFQLMVEVRNKLLESYQELMRMQI